LKLSSTERGVIAGSLGHPGLVIPLLGQEVQGIVQPLLGAPKEVNVTIQREADRRVTGPGGCFLRVGSDGGRPLSEPPYEDL
jgi:hypothetical protein